MSSASRVTPSWRCGPTSPANRSNERRFERPSVHCRSKKTCTDTTWAAGFNCRCAIAVTCGTAELVELGADGDRRFILVVGDVTDQSTSTLSSADPGDVVLSPACHRSIEPVAVGDAGPHDTYRVRALQATVRRGTAAHSHRRGRATDRILQVVPHPVKAWHEAGVEQFVAERREISTAFVALPDVDRNVDGWLDRLQQSVSSIDVIVTRYDGEIGQVVVDDKGCVVVAHWASPRWRRRTARRAPSGPHASCRTGSRRMGSRHRSAWTPAPSSAVSSAARQRADSRPTARR